MYSAMTATNPFESETDYNEGTLRQHNGLNVQQCQELNARFTDPKATRHSYFNNMLKRSMAPGINYSLKSNHVFQDDSS